MASSEILLDINKIIISMNEKSTKHYQTIWLASQQQYHDFRFDTLQEKNN